VAGTAQKQATVAELKASMDVATVAVVADYRGLTVKEMTLLRAELFKQDAQFTVAKNTLLKRAIQDSPNQPLEAYLSGPTAVLISRADQVQPVKTLREFLTKNKKPNEIRGGILDGKLLSPAEVDQLAKLPPLDELRAKLVGGIAYPLTGLANTLNSPLRSLVYVLDQVAKQKEAS
jgi:large subunit ribosomal protein L10